MTFILLWQTQTNANGELPYKELLTQYTAWAIKIDQQGMKIGQPLDEQGLLLAQEIGITSPEKVRVIYVDAVPYPYENVALKKMGETLGLIGASIVNNAQVFGYSIYVRKGFELNRPRMAHELVHVLQIERTSLSRVITQHVSDLSKYSYEDAPLEAEAFKANKKYAIKQ